jgi:hypothetical protein
VFQGGSLRAAFFAANAGIAIRVNVRFGSKADIGASVKDVRFTPKSGHEGSTEALSD